MRSPVYRIERRKLTFVLARILEAKGQPSVRAKSEAFRSEEGSKREGAIAPFAISGPIWAWARGRSVEFCQ